MHARSVENAALVVFLLAALVWHAATASIGWTHAISDLHGFRQAQTAITAYFIQQGGPWIAYETPVLGPPWRIPHELPVYQLLVVAVSEVSGLSLEGAGRATSLAFFYGTLGVAFLLLGDLGVGAWNRLLVLGFWLLSPHYVFWSRTFMIESTALFFCALFLLLAVRFVSRGAWVYAAPAVLSGALGAAVKPITVVPFVVLAGVCWLGALRKGHRPLLLQAAGALVLVLPLAAGWLWQRHADTLKGLDVNPLAWGIGSRQLFQDWILGPVGTWAGPDVRLNLGAWSILWSQRIPDTLGHLGVAAAALAGVAIARRRIAPCAVLVAATLVHFGLFLPLHMAHPYYFYATGGLLVVAVGLAAVALRECGDRRRHLAWLLAAIVAACGVRGYVTTLLPQQQADAYRKPAWFVRLAREIAARTAPDDVIVVFGMHWNPELPYYARRRALMWPSWGDRSPDGKDVLGSLRNLAGYPIGAVVSCSRSMEDATLAKFRALSGISAEDPWTLSAPTDEDHGAGRCVVYFRRLADAAQAGQQPWARRILRPSA